MLALLQYIDANFGSILKCVGIVAGVLAVAVIGVMLMELSITR